MQEAAELRLLFATHSGYGNQVQALLAAAFLSRAVGLPVLAPPLVANHKKTLVLPKRLTTRGCKAPTRWGSAFHRDVHWSKHGIMAASERWFARSYCTKQRRSIDSFESVFDFTGFKIRSRTCARIDQMLCPEGVDVDPHLLDPATNRNCTAVISCGDRIAALRVVALRLAHGPRHTMCVGPLNDWFFSAAGPRDTLLHSCATDASLPAEQRSIAAELLELGLPLQRSALQALAAAAAWNVSITAHGARPSACECLYVRLPDARGSPTQLLHDVMEAMTRRRRSLGRHAAPGASVPLEVLASNCQPLAACAAAISNASHALHRPARLVVGATVQAELALTSKLGHALRLSPDSTKLLLDQYRCARCQRSRVGGCKAGTVEHRGGQCPEASSSSFWQQIRRLHAQLARGRGSAHELADQFRRLGDDYERRPAPGEIMKSSRRDYEGRRDYEERPPAAAAEHGVAVCLAGWHQTVVSEQGANLRRHLIEPLHADVLIALTYRASEGCTTVAACGLDSRYASLLEGAQLMLERMPTVSELLAHLEALPHWTSIVRALNGTRHWRGFQTVTIRGKIYMTRTPRNMSCVRHAWREGDELQAHVLGGRATPYICDGLKEWGNTMFAPVVGPSNYNTLWQLHGLSRVHALLRRAEARRGARYERVVVSRLDYIWLTPHPPLRLLGRRCAWVPQAEDYGGLNDRHAVMNREHADTYLGRWAMIEDGRLMTLHPYLRRGVASALTGERALAALLRSAAIPVCRFAPTSFLACCEEHAGANLAGKAPKRCHNPQCHRVKVALASLPKQAVAAITSGRWAVDSAGRLEVRGKYSGEVRASVGAALALQLPTARWAVLPRPAERSESGWHDLGVLAPQQHAAIFNRTLRKALRGKGMRDESLIRWI